MEGRDGLVRKGASRTLKGAEKSAERQCKPGGSATLKLKRMNTAERLYRITGEGVYRDTVLLAVCPSLTVTVMIVEPLALVAGRKVSEPDVAGLV